MTTPPRGSTSASRITLIVFPGGFNWPVWVAEERGLFAQHGVAVNVVTTPGSVFQWTTLAKGETQIAITLMDNVLAYREGQGEPGIVVNDAIALMSVDTRAMPALVTTPDIRTYAGLKGKSLAVDALRTGNALVLMGMLERAGLGPDDYRFIQVGGVAQRFEGMKRSEFAGSLFNSPFQGLLQQAGFNILDTSATLLDHFQGHVVATRKAWATANRSAVVGFLRAFADAVDWLYEPDNRNEAFNIYTRNLPDSIPGAAATAYSVLFDPLTGFPRRGEVDVEGVRQVLALRARYGRPTKALDDVFAYYEPAFLNEAVGQR